MNQFGDNIATLKQDAQPNPQQQGNLEYLYNVLEALKAPEPVNEPQTATHTVQMPVEKFEQETSPAQKPVSEDKLIQQAHEHFASEGGCPVCSTESSVYTSVKKAAVITALYMFFTTPYFQTLLQKIVHQPSLQQVLSGAVFLTVCLLVIKYFNY